MSNLLTAENPLIVLPSLAVEFGLTEALLLQQIHYWLGKTDTLHSGKRWTYHTVEQWQQQMPFLSSGAIRRAMTKLRTLGVVIVAKLARWKSNRTNYYTLDYSKLAIIADAANQHGAEKPINLVSEPANASAQIEQIHVRKLNTSNRSNCADVYTKTNQRKHKEKTTREVSKAQQASTPIIGTAQPTTAEPSPDQLAQMPIPRRNLWQQLRQAKLDIAHDNPILGDWIRLGQSKSIIQTIISAPTNRTCWYTPQQLGLVSNDWRTAA